MPLNISNARVPYSHQPDCLLIRCLAHSKWLRLSPVRVCDSSTARPIGRSRGSYRVHRRDGGSEDRFSSAPPTVVQTAAIHVVHVLARWCRRQMLQRWRWKPRPRDAYDSSNCGGQTLTSSHVRGLDLSKVYYQIFISLPPHDTYLVYRIRIHWHRRSPA